jgi:hypothetical protein
MTMRGWPRSGVPRAFSDFRDFSQVSHEVAEAPGVADYTSFWWKLRPIPDSEPWRSAPWMPRRRLMTSPRSERSCTA